MACYSDTVRYSNQKNVEKYTNMYIESLEKVENETLAQINYLTQVRTTRGARFLVINRKNVFRRLPRASSTRAHAMQHKHGRKSLDDDPRSGRPTDVTTDDNVIKIQSMVMDDRRLTIDEIAKDIGLSHGTCIKI